jgi:hypothetical protein
MRCSEPTCHAKLSREDDEHLCPENKNSWWVRLRAERDAAIADNLNLMKALAVTEKALEKYANPDWWELHPVTNKLTVFLCGSEIGFGIATQELRKAKHILGNIIKK